MSNEGKHHAEQQESGPPTEKPEVTEEHKKKAKEMAEAYDETRPTTVLPGTGGAVAGTAVTDWVDDDGNPKYREGEGEADKEGDHESQDHDERAESQG